MQLFRLGISIVNVDKHEDGIINTNIRPKLSCFMFKMFKALVPTKPIVTPQELVLPWGKNKCPSNSSLHAFSFLTEECVSWRKIKPFEAT